jgi:8-oxo-dGTP pyrophosphatase MutT (NUDIX family)
MGKPPPRAAGVVVFRRTARGVYFLVLRAYKNWDFPKGLVEAGEDQLTCAKRELKEETGLDAAVDHLVGLYRLENGLTVLVFGCRIAGGAAAIPDTDEIAEVGWYEPSAMPRPVTNLLHHALADALAGARGVVRDALERLT